MCGAKSTSLQPARIFRLKLFIRQQAIFLLERRELLFLKLLMKGEYLMKSAEMIQPRVTKYPFVIVAFILIFELRRKLHQCYGHRRSQEGPAGHVPPNF